MKKTLIVGATPNTSRFAYKAADRLRAKGHEFIPIGIKKGKVLDCEIKDLNSKPEIEGIDTITLYINPTHQKEWEDYLLSLKPKRIIFNPGTENDALRTRAESEGIATVYGCTLVMLSSNQF